MDEATKRTWDVGLGIVGPILTVAGILVGVYQFNAGELNKVRFEHASKLWLEQLSSYRHITELAGKIVTSDDPADFKTNVRDFTAAYWGVMIFVENADVEDAMVGFYVELQDYQKGWSDKDRLKRRADLLIKACRKSAETPPEP